MVDDLAGTDHVEFFPGDFLEVKIVLAQAVDFLAQSFIVHLQPIILFVEFGFFPLQPPEMDRATITHHGVE
jgi:hypothetical protein